MLQKGLVNIVPKKQNLKKFETFRQHSESQKDQSFRSSIKEEDSIIDNSAQQDKNLINLSPSKSENLSKNIVGISLINLSLFDQSPEKLKPSNNLTGFITYTPSKQIFDANHQEYSSGVKSIDESPKPKDPILPNTDPNIFFRNQ